MAHKFSTSYEALRELEYTASQHNCKTTALRDSKFFKSFISHDPDRKIIHRATYPPARIRGHVKTYYICEIYARRQL